MAHDLVIRGGLVVDGTGSGPVPADVAIDGDRVTEVGPDVGPGRRELDAEGHYVTPGFVDVHTHLDAQLAWDPLATSSCWHGVTSVVLGNCGMGFAPCKPEDRRYLAEVMESVEDIPADAIMAGLDWSWESYGGYLDALDRMPKGVNAGGMVGHCALRWYAMGARSQSEDPASDEDIGTMVGLAEEAMASGALGISTSRTLLHHAPGRKFVPGTFADARELLALGDVLRRHHGGVFESVPSYVGGADDFTDELEVLTEIASSSGQPVTFTLMQEHVAPARHRAILDAVATARADGIPLYPQTTARSIGIWFGLVNYTPFDRAPAWRELWGRPLAERVAVLADPVGRQRLLDGVAERPPTYDLDAIYPLPAGDARYEFAPTESLAAVAGRRGVTAAQAFIDLTLEQDGRTLFLWPFLNDDVAAVEEMLRNPLTVLGLADAGAHVGQIMDASQPTWFLGHWVRDRGLSDLGPAVSRLTSIPAQLFGIADRGTLTPGAFADVNVFDLAAMRLPQPEYVHDFPTGAGRFIQRAEGYRYTLVNGEVFMEDGEHAGALAGRTLRSGTAAS
jgi:N-acyl-D-aspartate/D-glutamate deacylase